MNVKNAYKLWVKLKDSISMTLTTIIIIFCTEKTSTKWFGIRTGKFLKRYNTLPT